jgi:hypothetical protein
LLNEEAYASYHRATEKGLREIAIPANDRRRTLIDAFMFGTYGRDIVFAALSLNEKGLTNYGNCLVVLDEVILIPRLTVIEENSYNFANRHGVNLEAPEIPKGYRAIWENKMQLSVAKGQELLKAPVDTEDFCNLVLFSEGDRATDEFLEVHIFNELSTYCMKKVTVPRPTERKQQLDLRKLQHKYAGKIIES